MGKKISQKKIILNLLRSQPSRWFKSWELQKVETPFGWLGTSGDRVARSLAEDGTIARKHEKNTAFFKAMIKTTELADGRIIKEVV